MFFTLNKTFLIYFAPRSLEEQSGIKKITQFFKATQDLGLSF